MMNADEEEPMDERVSAHATLGEIATKLEATVSGVCIFGDAAVLQVASLKQLNASLKAEREALDVLRQEHADRRASDGVDQGTHQDRG